MTDIRAYEAMVKLDLSEEERLWVSERVSALLESFSALEGIDVTGVEPLVTVLDLENVLREDVARQLVSREELLSRAPERYDGYFQVPRTLE